MKSIYTILNNKVYKIDQNTSVPADLITKKSGISASLKENCGNAEAQFKVSINTLDSSCIKTNKELFNEMKQFLKDNGITEISSLPNTFKLYLDYSIIQDNNEVDRQSVLKPLTPIDKAYLLGVATNNETVYRRVKTFNQSLSFRTVNSVPLGIMYSSKKNYTFKINNIAIFEDNSSANTEVHKSTYDNPYCNCGHRDVDTVSSTLSIMNQIYSTENAEINIEPIELSYIPRSIVINIEFIYANLIVAYDENEVNNILVDIINSKYQKDEDIKGSDKDDPDVLIPTKDTKPVADGNYTPDKNGYFDFYERCNKSTPGALLVVEDLISDGYYVPATMIKKSMVIKDIPDISVGEYVIYKEAIDTNKTNDSDNTDIPDKNDTDDVQIIIK